MRTAGRCLPLASSWRPRIGCKYLAVVTFAGLAYRVSAAHHITSATEHVEPVSLRVGPHDEGCVVAIVKPVVAGKVYRPTVEAQRLHPLSKTAVQIGALLVFLCHEPGVTPSDLV